MIQMLLENGNHPQNTLFSVSESMLELVFVPVKRPLDLSYIYNTIHRVF